MNGNLQDISNVSVVDPISPAIEWTKEMLFRPFDIGKWFTIGFCAWLAMLGESGGFNIGGGPRTGNQDVRRQWNEIKIFFLDHPALVITIVVSVFLVIMVVSLVLMWLKSRGRFMFLHCVAQNRAEVKLPWSKYRQQGNSLFVFTLILSIASTVFILPIIVGGGFAVVFMVKGQTFFTLAGIGVLILLVLVLITMIVIFWLISKFTKDFVIPIMYLRQSRCMAAWGEFWGLLRNNKGRFALYILFQIVISIAIGFIVTGAVCITCCIAGCIMVIPYIGTVFLLPLIVFWRSYSLCYFRQYGRDFDVFVPQG